MDEPQDPQDNLTPPGEDVPYDSEPMDIETPRRAASAQFIVDREVGAEAALREAMDPANQSLAEALRLSYRVLQVVIAALIVVFLFSGFQAVENGQTGVMLRWGKILPAGPDGSEALASPGLHFSKWPYPAGEFILFDETGTVDIGNTFFPALPVSENALEDAASRAGVQDPLRPGDTGSLLTRDGDLVHLQMSGRYEVLDAADFVRCLPVQATDRMVQIALHRAAVRVAATLSLQEIVDLDDDTRRRIRDEAQRVLSRVDAGINLAEINIPQITPPLAIRRVYSELQGRRLEADATVAAAKKRAEETLLAAAGDAYDQVIDLIDGYEIALALDDTTESDALFGRINETLGSQQMGGDVAEAINKARGFRSEIESTLGQEAKRVATMRASYEQNPEILIKTLWLQSYGAVMSAADTEHFLLPAGLGAFTVQIKGSDGVKDMRRKMQLDEEERRLFSGGGIRPGELIPRGDKIRIDGPGRRLEVQDGRVVSPGG